MTDDKLHKEKALDQNWSKKRKAHNDTFQKVIYLQ